MKSRVTVIDVLDFLSPTVLWIAVHFVKEQVGSTMGIMVVGQVD